MYRLATIHSITDRWTDSMMTPSSWSYRGDCEAELTFRVILKYLSVTDLVHCHSGAAEHNQWQWSNQQWSCDPSSQLSSHVWRPRRLHCGFRWSTWVCWKYQRRRRRFVIQSSRDIFIFWKHFVVTFSALTLLFERWERHPACKSHNCSVTTTHESVPNLTNS